MMGLAIISATSQISWYTFYHYLPDIPADRHKAHRLALLNNNVMIYTIISGFALAAIMGMVLISHVLRNKPVPRAALVMHGLFAAISLVLLIVYVMGNQPGPMQSLVLFIIAATGGFIMLARELTGKPVPKWLAIVHGLLAASGLITLLVFALNG
jgi:hypothetical protein